jgi:LmbE family N-acetylglucosaminyl deacetylase
MGGKERYKCGKLWLMHWIYLSPHLDDVALSCGGWVWEQAQAGESVEIWTICAGNPPLAPVSLFARSLHDRWQTEQDAADLRREEDIGSCRMMGAGYRHFAWPDCIYRLGPDGTPEAGKALYDSEESLWGQIHPAEESRVELLSLELGRSIPAASQLVCPLTLGEHVDHKLVRQAVERLDRKLWYYADYPYALKSKEMFETLRLQGWESVLYPVSEAGLLAWIEAVAAHRSQISTFWSQDAERRIPAETAMQTALRDYSEAMGGVILWRSPS